MRVTSRADSLICRRPQVTSGVKDAGGAGAFVFRKAYEAKQYWLSRNDLHHSLADSVVFSKVKAKMGLDCVRVMVTGSAPIAAHVMVRARLRLRRRGFWSERARAAASIAAGVSPHRFWWVPSRPHCAPSQVRLAMHTVARAPACMQRAASWRGMDRRSAAPRRRSQASRTSAARGTWGRRWAATRCGS
jgi:hypothetical protein